MMMVPLVRTLYKKEGHDVIHHSGRESVTDYRSKYSFESYRLPDLPIVGTTGGQKWGTGT